MQVFDCCQGILTGLDSGRPIRRIWSNLKVNAFKWWSYLSAGSPMWGDKLPIKHERAIVLASLAFFVRLFVALKYRCTVPLVQFEHLIYVRHFLLMKCLFLNNTAFQSMLSFEFFLKGKAFWICYYKNRSSFYVGIIPLSAQRNNFKYSDLYV